MEKVHDPDPIFLLELYTIGIIVIHKESTFTFGCTNYSMIHLSNNAHLHHTDCFLLQSSLTLTRILTLTLNLTTYIWLYKLLCDLFFY